MIPQRIEGYTRKLNPPTDWDEEKDGPCWAVYVKDEVINGMQFMVMSYEPTLEELKALNEGAKIHFGINGIILPVHFINVL